MFHRFHIVPLAISLLFHPGIGFAQDIARPPSQVSLKDDTKEILTDAAIAALVIAGSIAIYKSTGRPCACPSDTMKNGAACGNRSAWAKPGGARPLCFPTDVTASMIDSYRKTKAIPAVW